MGVGIFFQMGGDKIDERLEGLFLLLPVVRPEVPENRNVFFKSIDAKQVFNRSLTARRIFSQKVL